MGTDFRGKISAARGPGHLQCVDTALLLALTLGLAACGGRRLNPWLTPASTEIPGGCLYLTGRLVLSSRVARPIETLGGTRYEMRAMPDRVGDIGLFVMEIITGGKCRKRVAIPWPAPPANTLAWDHKALGPLRFQVTYGLRTFSFAPATDQSGYLNPPPPEAAFPWPNWPWTPIPMGCCIGGYRLSLPSGVRRLAGNHPLRVRACLPGWSICTSLWWPHGPGARHPGKESAR